MFAAGYSCSSLPFSLSLATLVARSTCSLLPAAFVASYTCRLSSVQDSLVAGCTTLGLSLAAVVACYACSFVTCAGACGLLYL